MPCNWRCKARNLQPPPVAGHPDAKACCVSHVFQMNLPCLHASQMHEIICMEPTGSHVEGKSDHLTVKTRLYCCIKDTCCVKRTDSCCSSRIALHFEMAWLHTCLRPQIKIDENNSSFGYFLNDISGTTKAVFQDVNMHKPELAFVYTALLNTVSDRAKAAPPPPPQDPKTWATA